MRRIRNAIRHPLYSTLVAVWFGVLAWHWSSCTFSFMAGLVTAMAISDWADWYFDRWKERYLRGHYHEG